MADLSIVIPPRKMLLHNAAKQIRKAKRDVDGEKSRIEQEQICQMYRDLGRGSAPQIAAAFNRTLDSVCNILARHGLTRCREHPDTRRHAIIPMAEFDLKVKKLWDHGLAVSAISERLDETHGRVRDSCHRQGLTSVGHKRHRMDGCYGYGFLCGGERRNMGSRMARRS